MVQIIEENRRPNFGAQIAGNFGGGLGQGVSSLAQSALKNKFDRKLQSDKLKGDYKADEENYKKIKDAFGTKFAEIWMASPQGARTKLTGAALEARSRGIDLDKMLSTGGGQTPDIMQTNEMNPPIEQEDKLEKNVFNELNDIKNQQDKELLPAEKIARGKERYTTGLKEYQEAGTKLRGLTRDKERIEILEGLEKNKKLPKGLGRLNVDKDGNLRLPFLASKDSERYVKTLNEFSSGAKDTFGSRVTNFDLTQYLRRFPTLLNSAEGRRQLYDQMKIVNQINSIYYKNLKKVYDKAGGVRNIDSDVAERLAEKLSESKVSELSDKFKEIGDFKSLPAASEFKGKKMRDKKTGEVFLSDGENWVPT